MKEKKLKIWSDIYKLPLRDPMIIDKFRGGRVYDKKNNFVFQFLDLKYSEQKIILEILNGNYKPTIKHIYSVGEDPNIILCDNIPIIMIRGWGNLTGTGALHLSIEDATNIQDTFRDWIINKLTVK